MRALNAFSHTLGLELRDGSENVKLNRPAGVVVSMPSFGETKPTSTAVSSPSKDQVSQVSAESVQPPAH
jgi:hypothetical protein